MPDGGSSGGDERFRRRERMTRSADFLRCYRRGRRRRGSSATLHFHTNDRSNARLGITASRKIGGAVVRHRVKRRVREIYRRWVDRDAVAGLDVVVHLQPGCAQTGFDTFREELVRLFAEVARTTARESTRDGRSSDGRPVERNASERNAPKRDVSPGNGTGDGTSRRPPSARRSAGA